MLNEDLFSRLERAFRDVRITDENVAMLYQHDSQFHHTHISRRGEQYHINCPFCNDTRGRLALSYRWGQRDDKGHLNLWLMNCFNEDCQAEHANRVRLFDMLYRGQTPVPLNRTRIRRTPTTPPISPPGMVMDLRELPPSDVAIQYLRARGFDPAFLAEQFDVGLLCGSIPGKYMSNFLWNRLYIPVVHAGTLKGWQARYPGDEPPDDMGKYFNAPGMQKNKLLYGYDLARDEEVKVIVEGVTDVWRYGPGALALFGKSMSTTQAELLAKIKHPEDRVVVVLDADAAEDVAKVRQKLRDVGIRSTKVILPDGHDPGSMPTSELEERIEAALTSRSRRR